MKISHFFKDKTMQELGNSMLDSETSSSVPLIDLSSFEPETLIFSSCSKSSSNVVTDLQENGGDGGDEIHVGCIFSTEHVTHMLFSLHLLKCHVVSDFNQSLVCCWSCSHRLPL